jgi:hypothetical protein
VVGDVLAAPDSLAIRLLNHCRVVEATRLLNVRRLQVGSHEPILLYAQGSRTPAGQSQALMPSRLLDRYMLRPQRVSAKTRRKIDGQANVTGQRTSPRKSARGLFFTASGLCSGAADRSCP